MTTGIVAVMRPARARQLSRGTMWGRSASHVEGLRTKQVTVAAAAENGKHGKNAKQQQEPLRRADHCSTSGLSSAPRCQAGLLPGSLYTDRVPGRFHFLCFPNQVGMLRRFPRPVRFRP